MAFFQIGFRRAALGLSRVPIAYSPCLRQHLPAAPSKLQQLVRATRRQVSTSTSEPKSPLASLSSNISNSTKAAAPASAQSSGKSSEFPKTNAKVVGYWLLGSAASVFGIVVWGGLTRLTESGYVCPILLHMLPVLTNAV